MHHPELAYLRQIVKQSDPKVEYRVLANIGSGTYGDVYKVAGLFVLFMKFCPPKFYCFKAFTLLILINFPSKMKRVNTIGLNFMQLVISAYQSAAAQHYILTKISICDLPLISLSATTGTTPG